MEVVNLGITVGLELLVLAPDVVLKLEIVLMQVEFLLVGACIELLGAHIEHIINKKRAVRATLESVDIKAAFLLFGC